MGDLPANAKCGRAAGTVGAIKWGGRAINHTSGSGSISFSPFDVPVSQQKDRAIQVPIHHGSCGYETLSCAINWLRYIAVLRAINRASPVAAIRCRAVSRFAIASHNGKWSISQRRDVDRHIVRAGRLTGATHIGVIPVIGIAGVHWRWGSLNRYGISRWPGRVAGALVNLRAFQVGLNRIGPTNGWL